MVSAILLTLAVIPTVYLLWQKSKLVKHTSGIDK